VIIDDIVIIDVTKDERLELNSALPAISLDLEKRVRCRLAFLLVLDRYFQPGDLALEHRDTIVEFFDRHRIEDHSDLVSPGLFQLFVVEHGDAPLTGTANSSATRLPNKANPVQVFPMSLPPTMTAIVAAAPGGPDVLAPATVPLPMPKPGEALIRVAAAGMNYPDIAQRRGDYPPPEGHSPILGLEVSGEIAVPAGRWREGDKVVALSNGGAYAEYVAVPAGQILPAPEGWPLVDAAALPETWFTITQTLVMRAGLTAGMSVLVTGAAGGLGGAAIQIARILGAEPIALVGSAEKADYVRTLGATAIIRHDIEDVVGRARELTGGRGADRILDMLGGAATARHIDAAALFGHIVQVATLTDRNAQVPLNKLMAKQLTLSGSTLRPQSPETKAAIAAHLRQHIWPALDDATFPRPKIRRFALAQAADAIERRKAATTLARSY
jgi:NADPH2:quinone reductase